MSDNKEINSADERKGLYQLCKDLGISVSPNAGIEVLTQKISEYYAQITSENSVLKTKLNKNTKPKISSENIFYDKNIDQGKRLVRCIVTCNNPDKRDATGEIHTAGNAKNLESRYIAYRIAWHVPQIILNSLKEKKYTLAKQEIDPKTNKVIVKTDSFPEYSIEVLDPLTEEEFNAIKQRQLAQQAENRVEETY